MGVAALVGLALLGLATRAQVDHWRSSRALFAHTVAVTPPNFVELEVTETDPGLKGDTASGGTKPATLSTGATVKGVPLFVNIGDVLKIDTRTGEYVSRVR